LPYHVLSDFVEVHRERYHVEAMCAPSAALHMEVDKIGPALRRAHCQNEEELRKRKRLYCFGDLNYPDSLVLYAFATQAFAMHDFRPAIGDLRPEFFFFKHGFHSVRGSNVSSATLADGRTESERTKLRSVKLRRTQGSVCGYMYIWLKSLLIASICSVGIS
jgi:hypothetical protein